MEHTARQAAPVDDASHPFSLPHVFLAKSMGKIIKTCKKTSWQRKKILVA